MGRPRAPGGPLKLIDNPRTRMRSKLIAAFASSLLVLLVAYLANDALVKSEADQAWVDHTVQVRSLVRSALEKLYDVEVKQLTYLLTGDPDMVASMDDAAADIGHVIDELEATAGDNPKQLGRIMRVRPLVAANLDEIQRTIGLARLGHADKAVELVGRNSTREIFQHLSGELQAMRNDENALLEQRRSTTSASITTSRLVLIVGAVVAFVLSLLVMLLIRRGVDDLTRAHAQIAAQAVELRDKTVALERSLKDLDQFAYVASHDLKAPLRGIASLAQWIAEDDNIPDGAEARREHLRLMEVRVARMESLVDGILAYSRAARSHVAPELVDVGRLLREVIDLVAPPPHVAITIEGALDPVRTERVPFQQVWMNLIGNAVKHGGRDGRVEIRLGLARVEAGERVYFVADGGPGIDPRFHDRVFSLFQTLAPRDRVEGTGIGLAIVKKLVEYQGGRIWIESSPGQGAAFYFTWPESREASKPMAPAPARPIKASPSASSSG